MSNPSRRRSIHPRSQKRAAVKARAFDGPRKVSVPKHLSAEQMNRVCGLGHVYDSSACMIADAVLAVLRGEA